ncbi:hypothetical protein L2E82_41722 [Cichorium intybus]|uniref:Uncharacterized protein n=1 Tax=Cichorium intybus TaxID=13427 RepID=A0ACB8ZQ86_CICIN|nr:hypothetical protein L2E82_41722 [Cichorium intybus]
MVKENTDGLGMEPTEALSGAIKTLTLQGIDLSGISLDWTDEIVLEEALDLFDNLTALSRIEGSEDAAIATRNGGIELMCSVCSKLSEFHCDSALASVLNALAAFLHAGAGQSQCRHRLLQHMLSSTMVRLLFLVILDSVFVSSMEEYRVWDSEQQTVQKQKRLNHHFVNNPHQVVIVPIWKKANEKNEVLDVALSIKDVLHTARIKVKLDDSNQRTPGWKFNFWEMKGVPLRIEIGPRDVSSKSVVVSRRDITENQKGFWNIHGTFCSYTLC